MLKAAHITISFDHRDILRDVSTYFKPGLHFLIGANGSGKTTLLKAMMGAIDYKGDFLWKEQSLRTLGLKSRAHLLAWLPQHPSWPAHLTVEEYVFLGRFPHISWMGSYSANDRKVVDETLKDLELLSKKDQAIGELSGGERQQVALARALVQDTPVLVLDEPAQALDPANKQLLYDRLRAIAAHKTVICTSHDLEALEVPGATVHALKDGKLLWVKASPLERINIMKDVFL